MEQCAEKKRKKDPVGIIDCGCRAASCAILFFMTLLMILSRTPAGAYLPQWLGAGSFFRKYLLPVLSSAAVGYLTNAIAIWMLFRPYEKHRFLPQGVIPKQKKRFGHELGILIPQHLLQPEKISAQIGKVVLQYLKDPLFVRQVRDQVNAFLIRHSDKITDAAVPYVQTQTVRLLRENMTREQFNRLFSMLVRNFLNDPAKREKTVQTAVALFRALLPEFSGDLKEKVAEQVAGSFRQEHPLLSWCKDNFTGSSIEEEIGQFWIRGEKELLDSLGRRDTQERLAGYFAQALTACQAWLGQQENTVRIDHFLQESRISAEHHAKQWLAEKIPQLADEILSSDSFWLMLQERALPALQLFAVKQLRSDSNSLLAKLDLPGKIENAVDEMNMKQLHEFVIQASNNNLTVLQVLGFFLGAAAGVIMAFAM